MPRFGKNSSLLRSFTVYNNPSEMSTKFIHSRICHVWAAWEGNHNLCRSPAHSRYHSHPRVLLCRHCCGHLHVLPHTRCRSRFHVPLCSHCRSRFRAPLYIHCHSRFHVPLYSCCYLRFFRRIFCFLHTCLRCGHRYPYSRYGFPNRNRIQGAVAIQSDNS